MTDCHKLEFRPNKVLFGSACPFFIAVWGSKQVQVLTLANNGKVKASLPVNLMLEAYGDELSILDVQWVSATVLAVGTKQFIRVYDLAKDNISPQANLLPLAGDFTAFTIATGHIFASVDNKIYQYEL